MQLQRNHGDWGEEWVNCYYCYHQDHNNTNTDDDDDDNDNGGEDGNKRLLYGHTIDDVYGKHLGQRKTSQKFIHTSVHNRQISYWPTFSPSRKKPTCTQI